MIVFVTANGSGKLIRVVDRIAGQEVLNSFVDAGSTVQLNVASNNGQDGDIDLYKRLQAQNPWTVDRSDYTVRVNENMGVDD